MAGLKSMHQIKQWIGCRLQESAVLIGVDITSSSLKLLELSHKEGQYQVENFYYSPFSPGAEAHKAIVEAFKTASFSCKNIAVALPDSAVFSKIIQIEAGLPQREIEAQLLLEAAHHLPHPMEEISLDFQLLNQENVLLVATHKHRVESLTAALSVIGIKVAAVDVESFAVDRVCRSLLNGNVDLNPFAAMSLSDKVDPHLFASLKAEFMLCCGLSLRNFDSMQKINLLPWREQLRARKKKQWIKMLSLVVTVAIGIILLLHLAIDGKIHSSEIHNNLLQQQVTQMNGIVQKVQKLQHEKNTITTQIKYIHAIQTDKLLARDIFSELANQIPDDMFLTSIKREGNTIVVTGKAKSSVYLFMRKMEASPWLARAIVSEIKTIPGQKPYIYDFTLTLKIKKYG